MCNDSFFVSKNETCQMFSLYWSRLDMFWAFLGAFWHFFGGKYIEMVVCASVFSLRAFFAQNMRLFMQRTRVFKKSKSTYCCCYLLMTNALVFSVLCRCKKISQWLPSCSSQVEDMDGNMCKYDLHPKCIVLLF